MTLLLLSQLLEEVEQWLNVSCESADILSNQISSFPGKGKKKKIKNGDLSQ